MNGLIIKKKWLDLILTGDKTWEIRGSRTKVRGKIALIQKSSGLVIGEAKLVEVIGPLSRKELLSNINRHHVSKASIKKGIRYKTPFAWVLENVKQYRKPKPYQHPQGAVIWVKDVL